MGVDRLFPAAFITVQVDQRSRKLHYEIEHLDADEMLGTSVEDWCDYFVAKFRFEVPALLEDEISVQQDEVEINVSSDPGRDARREPVLIQGTRITFVIPFDGDDDLFRFRPSTYTTCPPRGEVRGHELHVSYVLTDHDGAGTKKEFDENLSEIRRWLGWLAESVQDYNDRLRQVIRNHLEQRRDKILKDREMTAGLGFPLRTREDARKTYVVDAPRKRISPRRPSPGDTPFRPEPVLDDADYEQVIATIEHMVAVMERSPSAFKTLGEEDLRQHLLFGLNATFEGRATGETFNFQGKTDILLRENDKNLFIAECKIWGGPKKLADTIDQLLGYTSWRDTKTAIVIFNRNRNFSAVLEQIRPPVERHSNFKRWLPYEHESAYRCVLHHRDDVNRELILTIMAFEVPRPD